MLGIDGNWRRACDLLLLLLFSCCPLCGKGLASSLLANSDSACNAQLASHSLSLHRVSELRLPCRLGSFFLCSLNLLQHALSPTWLASDSIGSRSNPVLYTVPRMTACPGVEVAKKVCLDTDERHLVTKRDKIKDGTRKAVSRDRVNLESSPCPSLTPGLVSHIHNP